MVYVTDTFQESKYFHKILTQSGLVKKALLYLASLPEINLSNEHRFLAEKLSSLNELSPSEDYSAYRAIKKHWRELRQVDIVLPKKWINNYKLEGLRVLNLSKGSSYDLDLIGDDELSCSCEAYAAGHDCGHIKFALPLLTQQDKEAVGEVKVLERTEPVVEILPGIFGNPGQLKALDELMNFLNTGEPLHLLTGFAGTGKSTIIQALIKRLRDSHDYRKIVFTAPYNKATGVLRSMVEQWGLSIDCMTCSKLLGLRPEIDEDGKEIFVQDYEADCKIRDYKLVVVDECSTVSSDLWQYLTQEAGLLTQILLTGDPAQLPPVGEAISKTFTKTPNQSHLTEVMRYRGSIAEIAGKVRSSLHRRGELIIETEHSPDKSEGLFLLDQERWNAAIIKAFQSDKYLADPNFCRVLAWTNKRVAEINLMIRLGIYGKNTARFRVGERLIGKSPYGDFDPLFQTSSEMEVLGVWDGEQGPYKVWFLEVLVFETNLRCVIPVLHEDSFEVFKEDQRILAENKQWSQFYRNKKEFAHIEYAYCLTAHKAQGSTFVNAFVDLRNIRRNTTVNDVEFPGKGKQIIYERNQLTYVSFTRAAKRLFVYE